MEQRLRRTAREAFGYVDLRPGQLEAVSAVVEGRDTLVVMPTGSGKSATYQVPALLRDGPTVVVSPLLSLQRDQVAVPGVLAGGSPDLGEGMVRRYEGDRIVLFDRVGYNTLLLGTVLRRSLLERVAG